MWSHIISLCHGRNYPLLLLQRVQLSTVTREEDFISVFQSIRYHCTIKIEYNFCKIKGPEDLLLLTRLEHHNSEVVLMWVWWWQVWWLPNEITIPITVIFHSEREKMNNLATLLLGWSRSVVWENHASKRSCNYWYKCGSWYIQYMGAVWRE